MKRLIFNHTILLLMLSVVSKTLSLETPAAAEEVDSNFDFNERILQENATNETADSELQEDTCPCAKAGSDGLRNNATDPMYLQLLALDVPGVYDQVAWNARDYEELMGGKYKIEVKRAPSMPSMFEEIENDARSGGGLFDAYYTNPLVLGTAAVSGGLLDLSEYVKQSPYAEWTDVLLALRKYVTSFEGKDYIILLDGDTHTLYYRRDVLEAFDLKVPRTWDEYIEVAKTVHGRTFNGIELSGSCVSRIEGDHAMYWSHLVLSTITQTRGTSQGSLFDTKDMTPLMGEAAAEMLRIHEMAAFYGAPDEFTETIHKVPNNNMNEGSCVLTFFWGDLFRRSNYQGSDLHDKLGVAPTPGSQVVLNRKTGKLEKCTKELCPYAIFYDDIGFVNAAPYAANGGWGGAISANTSPEKQKALADFFLWAAGTEQSQKYVIPNSTLPWYEINGQDPFRKSTLDVDRWVEQGFDRELSNEFVKSIMNNLVSKNVVIEARFPKAGEIMSVLDHEVYEYLLRAHAGLIPEDEKYQQRLRTAKRITHQWNYIIKAYNVRGDTEVPILEIYQRLRGVYVPNEEKNHLTKIRPVGLTLMALITLASFASLGWVAKNRKTKVVLSSQPPFLALICLGSLILGSSIIAMGIDDGIASQDGCNMACMAAPWLAAVGFTICFAAPFSKIWRLNKLMKSAKQFRKIRVRVVDVLIPFGVLIALNVIFLTTATVTDPLYWERVDLGRLDSGELVSYGRCTGSGKMSTLMLILVGVVNIFAVILATVQAYQTRNLTVAYHESKFIGLAIFSILQCFLIGLPLLFLADDNPVARYVVRSVFGFVICSSILGFVILPKVFHDPEEDIASSSRYSSYGSVHGSALERSNRSNYFTNASAVERSKYQQDNNNEGSTGSLSKDEDGKSISAIAEHESVKSVAE